MDEDGNPVYPSVTKDGKVGDEVTESAPDAVGYITPDDQTIMLKMSGNEITFVYVAQSFLINTTVINGTIAPEDPSVGKYGSQTFNYSPDTGYHLVSVTVDGNNVTTGHESSYTFTNVTATHTITVVYAANLYTITWENWDGYVLETDTDVPYGQFPTYGSDTPTKPSDAQYTYTFDTWSPVLSPVTDNITYTATFTPTLRSYTVTWMNGSTQLEKDEDVPYGTAPSYDQASDPTKAATAEFTYTFDGWSTDPNATSGTAEASLPTVAGNLTYYAIFTAETNEYTVTWMNGSTQLEKDEDVPYGTAPSYDQASDPTKAATAEFTYTFDGWSTDPNATSGTAEASLPTVAGNVTYYAIFTAETNEYTVTWMNGSTQLEKDEDVPYGTAPSYDQASDPTKAATAEFTYTFDGWNTDPNATSGTAEASLPTVAGNVTYYAIFTAETNEYTVTWMNGSTQLEKDEDVPYGTAPSYDQASDPTKAATAEFTYTFDGWSTDPNATSGTAEASLPTVAGNVTYYAIFTAETNEYTVTWMNGSTQLEKDEDVPYGTAPSYDQASDPTKAATAEFTYTFDGWSTDPNAASGTAEASLPTVAGNVTYYAIFTAETNEYTVTWMNGSTQLEKDEDVPYGTAPSYDQASDPTKAATAEFTYTFDGWSTDPNATSGTAEASLPTVAGNVTYYAIFTAETNEYTVTWMNGSTQLEKDEDVPYGTAPSYDQASDPTKAATAEFTYTFDGWSTDPNATSGTAEASLPTVAGNVTYYAIFTAETNEYTVTWMNGSTQLEKDEDVPYGTAPSYDQASDPTKAATAEFTYTFDGWSTDPNATSGTAEASLPTVAGNVTYYAIFTAETNEYTVTWMNGSTQLEKDEDVPYGTAPSYDQASDPTKAATAEFTYTFDGWSTDPNATSGTAEASLPTVAGNVTYYAIFTAETNEYTVTWMNGSTQLEKDEDVPYGTAPSYDQASDPTKAATAEFTYTFDGWSTDPNATSGTAEASLPTVAGNLTYYAIFTAETNEYTVTWMNGSTQLEKDEDVPYGTAPSYDQASDPTKAATAEFTYTFDGWSTDPNATSGTAEASLPTVAGNVTYYAIFTAETNEYTVTWMNGSTQLEKDEDVPYGTAPSYDQASDPTKAATAEFTYTFDGWNTDPNATSGTAEASLPTVAGNVTYYAIFTAETNEYTVTWMNGSTQLEKDEDVPYGTAPSYDQASDPTKAATAEFTYTFDGWSTDPNATSGTAEASLPTVAGNVTYYAIFTAETNEYTVTWMNGSTQLEKDEDVPYGTAPSYDQASDPTKAATAEFTYTFDGWSTDPNAASGTAEASLPTVAGNVTYYAIFTAETNEYTVTWMNGSTQLEKDEDVPYGTAPSYDQASDPTKAATAEFTYTFDGWSTDPNATSGTAEASLPTVAGNVTYYAIFTAETNEYTVTYNAGAHGALVGASTDTVLYNEYPDYVPGITEDTGYDFIGWSSDGGTTLLDADGVKAIAVTGNITYTAYYEKEEYTVTFYDYDGTVLGTETVKYEDGATAPPDPDNWEGHHFTGWDRSFNPVTGDLDVTAVYAINTYTVRFFRADGVTQIGTSQTVNWSDAATMLTAPGRVGATFTGWVLTGDDATVTTSLNNVRENIDAVASYDRIVLVVRFEDYDGTLLGADNVLYGGDATAPTDPTREGYDFTGWSPSYDNVTDDLTVTAQYKIKVFTVTFVDFNGTVLDTQVVEWNTGATAPAEPAREGYNFTGWDKEFDPVTSDLTVTAQYTEIVAPTPEATEIPEEPPATGGGPATSWLWWLLLIPALGLLIWLLLAWLSIVPIAEAVTSNGDGTMTIQWGYENRKGKKKKLDEQDSELSALSGSVIRNSQEPPFEFDKGRVENVFTTIAAAGSQIQWKIRNRKAKVDLSKVNKK